MSFCLVSHLLPVSAGFGVAERSEAQTTGGRARVGRGCEAQRSEAIPNRTDSGSGCGGSLRFSAGFGETSGEARCGKPQFADDSMELLPICMTKPCVVHGGINAGYHLKGN
jgi:hypothetical protein